jgi:RHS repeat-associated protein
MALRYKLFVLSCERTLTKQDRDYVGGLIEVEDDGTTVQTKRYASIMGAGLVYHQEADKFFWILPDELGSARLIVRDDSDVTPLTYTVIRGFNYEVYGLPTTIVENANALIYNYLFTGQYFDDELQLYNYLARFYDPEIARFLQVDPIHQGFSPYVYVNGMPNIATDPTGMAVNLALGLGLVGIGALLIGISYIPGLSSEARDGLFYAGAVTIFAASCLCLFGSAAFAGGVAAGGINFSMQLAFNGGDVKKVNPREVLLSVAIGAFGAGAGGFASSKMITFSPWVRLAAEGITQGALGAGTGSLEAFLNGGTNEEVAEAAAWGGAFGFAVAITGGIKGARSAFRKTNRVAPANEGPLARHARELHADEDEIRAMRDLDQIPGNKITGRLSYRYGPGGNRYVIAPEVRPVAIDKRRLLETDTLVGLRQNIPETNLTVELASGPNHYTSPYKPGIFWGSTRDTAIRRAKGQNPAQGLRSIAYQLDEALREPIVAEGIKTGITLIFKK